MSYRLAMRPQARRALGELPRDDAQRIDATIQSLSEVPRPVGSRKLRGGADLYRVRVGSYRIVYQIDDKARTLLIARIAHRRDVYR